MKYLRPPTSVPVQPKTCSKKDLGKDQSTYYTLYLIRAVSTNDFFKDGRLEVSPSTYYTLYLIRAVSTNDFFKDGRLEVYLRPPTSIRVQPKTCLTQQSSREGPVHALHLIPTGAVSINDFFKDGRLEVSPSTYKRTDPTEDLFDKNNRLRKDRSTYYTLHLLRAVSTNDFFKDGTSLRTVVLRYLRPPTSVPVQPKTCLEKTLSREGPVHLLHLTPT